MRCRAAKQPEENRKTNPTEDLKAGLLSGFRPEFRKPAETIESILTSIQT
jgi:hypothetical protein